MSISRPRTLRNGEVIRNRMRVFLYAIVFVTTSTPALSSSSVSEPVQAVSGDVELGYEELRKYLANEPNIETGYQLKTSVDFHLNFRLSEKLTLESAINGETGDGSKTSLDELLIHFEAGKTDMFLGQFTDIHFSSETRFTDSLVENYLEADAKGLLFSAASNRAITLSGAGFRLDSSEYEKSAQTSNLAGAVSLEYSSSEEFVFTLGLVSDLLHVDNELVATTVPALFLQLEREISEWSVLLEYGVALATYDEVNPVYSKPSVALVEVHYALGNSRDIGFLIESSKQLFEEPERQYGVIFQQELYKSFTYSLEYLESRYSAEQRLLSDDDREKRFILTTTYHF